MIILTDVSLIMNSMVDRDSSSLEKLLVYEDDNDEVVWSGSCGVSSGMLMCLFWPTEELLRKSKATFTGSYLIVVIVDLCSVDYIVSSLLLYHGQDCLLMMVCFFGAGLMVV